MGRTKNTRFPILFTLVLAMGSILVAPTAQAESGWTWVSTHTGPGGEPIDGFHRRSERAGFDWIAPHLDDEAPTGDALTGWNARNRSWHQRSFKVARPSRTSMTVTIQKRTITRGSGQPLSSKW